MSIRQLIRKIRVIVFSIILLASFTMTCAIISGIIYLLFKFLLKIT